MDVFLAIVAWILLAVGLVGSVVPVIPGPPLGYAGIVILHFTSYTHFSMWFFIIFGVLAIAVTILDYFIPVWGTKKFGGTKAGKTGSIIGVFAGIFLFPPIGIILGPFVGAFIGEMIHDSSNTKRAIKSATGSFLGFLLGTGLKLVISGLLIFYAFTA